MPEFVLSQWCAWAPGLKFNNSRLIATGDTNLPANVPKLLQRRLTPLAKAVFNVAAACLSDGQTIPVVFSSAHGEICKSLIMLQTIQAGQELSPTAFSLSVHNAIAGLFSIAFNNHQEITVIAPGLAGIAAAFIEAVGMLVEGNDEVLILFYDEPIAEFYPIAPFNLNTAQPCVLGLRLTLSGEGLELQFNRSENIRHDGEQPPQLLSFINFLLSAELELCLGNQGESWIWRKH